MKPEKVFSKEDIEKVELFASSLTKQQMADYFGICFNTLQRIFERQPEVSEAYRRGRAMAVITVAGSVLKEAQQGNIQAASLYLKTQAGWKETDRKEITGVDGGPIKSDTHWTIEVVGVNTDNPVDDA